MATQRFLLDAKVNTERPEPVRRALVEILGEAAVEPGGTPSEFIVRKETQGENAKALNRDLLSALRRVEKRTRLRSEWKAQDGTVYRFFDYVLKKTTEG